MADEKKPAPVAQPAKKTCFVIGPIGKEDSDTRRNADNLFHGLIEPALQECGIDFDVRRADHIPDPGSITEQVINAVVDSDLVIADLSERNPNAYYELGIRHAARKPTIHVIAVGHEIPFDNKDNRAISFDPLSITSLRKIRPLLLEQIRSCMAPGYKPSNPVTLALGAKEIRLSADPRDKVVSDLTEQMIALRLEVANISRQRRGSPWMDMFREDKSDEGISDVTVDALGNMFLKRKDGQVVQILPDAGGVLRTHNISKQYLVKKLKKEEKE